MKYDGSIWSVLNSGTIQDLNDIVRYLKGTSERAYAVGNKGTILHYNEYLDKSVYFNRPESVAVGQNFNVTVGISRTTDLYTGRFSIEYAPDIVRVVSPNVSNGKLYGNTTYTVLTAGNGSLNGSRPDKQGKIEITFNLSNYTNPIGDTEGTLAEIYFSANSSGSTNLSFVSVLNLSDYSSAEILPISWYNSSITVYETQPPAITTLACSPINYSAMNLTWTATGSGGDGSEYDIRYRPNGTINDSTWGSSATNECTGEPQPNASSAIESFDVLGLDPNTLYYFAIKVSDPGSYFSNISNSPFCTTPQLNHSLAISSNPPEGGVTSGDGI
jgi:hypothetical protein